MPKDFNNPQQLTPMDEMEVGDLVNLDIDENVRFEVLCVHGGWLYTRTDSNFPSMVTTTLVPKPLFSFKHHGG